MKTSQMPKLFAGQYNAEISALLVGEARRHPLELLGRRPRGADPAGRAARPDEAEPDHPDHRRDGDAQARRADSRTARCSARAGRSGRTRRTTRYNKWFPDGFEKQYKEPPNYASYQMAQAFLGVKLGLGEGAGRGNGGKRPTQRAGAAPRSKGMTFEGPGGTVRMAIGKGHQAIMETAYGQTKLEDGKLTSST